MFKRNKKSNRKAFTLVELLMALTVSSIILAAVASLAFAFSSAYNAGDETSDKQSRLRITTLRISELIKNSKLVLDSSSGKIVLWQSDYNSDNKINPHEIIYIDSGSSRNFIKLIEFDMAGAYAGYWIGLSDIQNGWFYSSFTGAGLARYTTFIPVCGNAAFTTDANPPYTKRVTLSFDLTENGIVHNYQINSALRCWAGNLINSSGILVTQDDD